MKPTTSELNAAALAIVQLDSESRIANWNEARAALVAQHGVSEKRATTAVATAARRLRNARFAEEGTSDYTTLRIRLTEPQRRRAQVLADRETGGNLSALFRLHTLG